jgi:hypothetical protein
LWFIAAFEDGKATPNFLAGYEVDLRAALEAAGTESLRRTAALGGVRAGACVVCSHRALAQARRLSV